MKKSELMKKLQPLDEDCEICLFSERENFVEVLDVEVSPGSTKHAQLIYDHDWDDDPDDDPE